MLDKTIIILYFNIIINKRGFQMNEKIKKHLMKVVNEEQAERLISENLKYFEYLEQPKKIANAILAVM